MALCSTSALFLPVASCEQDIPTAYWSDVGELEFDKVVYNVTGPVGTMMVNSAMCIGKAQIFCYLTQGWSAFIKQNRFKLGDKIKVEKVGAAELRVSKIN